MSLYVDVKFTQLLSARLDRFSQKGDYLWNFRCPICGDSKKIKYKARGYIYRHGDDDNLLFKCHNCNAGMLFVNFLRVLDGSLYQQYTLENYTATKELNALPKLKKKIYESPELKSAISVLSLDSNHAAIQYIKARKIPKDKWNLIYYTDNFSKFIEAVQPEETRYKALTDPRLIFPFYNKAKQITYLQGRALLPSKFRYVTLKLKDDEPKLYGLERWNSDPDVKTYVVEGPIDSLFLPNCLALAGSTIDYKNTFDDTHNTVFVFDNEKSNKDIVHEMQKVAEIGFSICVWPESVKEKDINEMICGGYTSEELVELIDKNTCARLEAVFRLNNWKRG